MEFRKKYRAVSSDKQSQLCVGIDPAYPGVRPGNVIPACRSPAEDILSFSLGIIAATGRYAAVFKPNLQYILPLGLDEMRTLNDAIHAQGALSLLDVKLSDIGATNASCCFWAREAGFDALTASPFPGNIPSLWDDCKKRGLGLFLLCLMSNPEAGMFMKSRVGGELAYAAIAKAIASEGITGAVVGATIGDEDAHAIASLLTRELALIPGIGAQQGSTDVLRLFGERSVVNVSRGVIFADDPAKKAKEYRDQIAKICF